MASWILRISLESSLYFNLPPRTNGKGLRQMLGPALSCTLPFANFMKRPFERKYAGDLRTVWRKLLDLFFARLLPSGTGDFGIGPSQLREKQTNPIMVCTLSFDGAFFYFNSFTVSCWTYFLPGFCRAVPVISTPALLGLGKSKRTQLGAIDVHCGTSITGIIIGHFCFVVNKIMHIKPNGFLLSRPWSLFLSYEFIYEKWRYLAILPLYTYTCVCV